MKKSIIIKAIVSVVVFFISIVVISAIMNQSSLDITTEMSEATLPLVYIEDNGNKMNCMHGYSMEMDTKYMRQTITPLTEERTLSLRIEKYNAEIQGLSYEIRSLDGSRLVESTEIYNYIDSKDAITATISIKDLIEVETEYLLVILVQTKTGETVRYYTHIIEAEGYEAKKKVDFALDFSARTFDKEQAKELTKYLESNSEGDNTTYSKVNINSSFYQITWGDLQINRETEPDVFIRELASQTATIELRYVVSCAKGAEKDYYNVVESFRIRLGTERMYLLDYERSMNQMFDWKNTVFVNNKIVLGITGEEVQMLESDGGGVVSFVQENRLYSYNASGNKVAYIFGFYDEENNDLRTLYDDCDIRILKVDETGNIRFVVYGYMNRGSHEGEVGVLVYSYDSSTNTIEEDVFIPYTKPFSLLKKEVEELAYINNSNQLFMILDATLWSINLEEKTSKEIVNNLPIGSYKVSDSNRMVVWQEGRDLDACTQLNLMNFNSGKQSVVASKNGEYIKPIGFMGEDLIYGIAKQQEIVKDNWQSVLFPMYALKIQDEHGNVLKTYQKDGYYVVNAQIVENQLNLNRVVKTQEESGEVGYLAAEDDQIMDSDAEESGSIKIEIATTEEYEKIVQIALKKGIDASNMKFMTPKEVMYEGGREITMEPSDRELERYYVYSLKGVEEVFEDVSEAVKLADELSGVVINDTGSYVWMKGNRGLKNQIMKIEGSKITEEKNSVAVCLDTILKCEGVTKNSEQLLNAGGTVVSILEENLPEAEILDLSGCSLDSVLYYVNRDIPVMAMLNDGNAVLIVGFNELNTVIMDPLTGKVAKKGINDSTEWFEENGNCFVTYIR